MFATLREPAVQFAILGSVEAAIEGRTVPVGPPKRRLLLALLLHECGRPVAMDRLVEHIWGSRPPPSARQVVFSHVSRLRKALADGNRSVELAGVPAGYLLRVDPDCVDVHVFRRKVAAARAVKEPAARSDAFRAALALWRGPALENLATDGGAERLSHSLEELRLDAIEARIDADLALGRHAGVVGELALLVADHPLRERLVEQYIVALYRCGGPARALAAYHQGRAVLREALGLDPGPSLTALHDAILRRDPSLAWTPSSADRPAPAAVSGRGPARLPLIEARRARRRGGRR